MPSDSTLAKITLKPLSKVYGAVTAVRNKMFDWHVIKEHEFDIPVISVGNLAVGGTGKTPHTEYIVNLLKDRYNIAILSRGYKRRTKGFVLATPHSTPRDIGDESYQMYHKFGRQITVAVCENRVNGIEKLREINPDINLVILDDAFQHRHVKPKLSIVLTEYNRPFYEDEMMPYGRLRESTKSIERADIVIVTKCPGNIKALDYRLFEKKLNLIPAQDLFFTRYRYDAPRPVFADSAVKAPRLDSLDKDDTLLAVSGIGNPRPFVRYLKSFDARVKVNVFPDHHEYNRKDMQTLTERFASMPKGRRYIITTEKDAVRLINNPYFPHELKPYIFFIPVRVGVVRDDPSALETSILRFINNRIL